MSTLLVFTNTYLFYIIALGLGVIYYRYIPSSAKTMMGRVQTDSMQPVDFAGIALIICWYSLGFSALLFPKAELKETISIADLSIGIISQIIPFGIVLVMLALREINISQLLNIRWKKFALILLIAPAGVVVSYAFANLLVFLGYDAWMADYFGDDAAQQHMISVYQATDAIAVRGMMAVMVIIIAPVAEEVIFRGYIYPVTKKFTSAPVATLLTSILFGVVHFNISALVPLIFLAIILTVAYELTNSIWAPISIHALFNTSTIAYLEHLKATNL